ncbi:MAG TPA: TlpA disulfide reductase family protein [Glycomyces sp.]|nr:TlpA disulfide reductase family protein [Glycomyces sp.]
MRKALLAATAALTLIALAACTEQDGGSGIAIPGDEGDSTWSVACTPGTTPIEALGDLELDCLGDDAPTTVGAGDKPLVVVLWATWCRPCRDEAPEVEAFYQAHGDQVDVLGVDTADREDDARWFAEEYGMTFPSVFDPEEAVRTGLGVPALPGVAFVNPDGTVAELIVQPGLTAESLAGAAESAFGLELP